MSNPKGQNEFFEEDKEVNEQPCTIVNGVNTDTFIDGTEATIFQIKSGVSCAIEQHRAEDCGDINQGSELEFEGGQLKYNGTMEVLADKSLTTIYYNLSEGKALYSISLENCETLNAKLSVHKMVLELDQNVFEGKLKVETAGDSVTITVVEGNWELNSQDRLEYIPSDMLFPGRSLTINSDTFQILNFKSFDVNILQESFKELNSKNSEDSNIIPIEDLTDSSQENKNIIIHESAQYVGCNGSQVSLLDPMVLTALTIVSLKNKVRNQINLLKIIKFVINGLGTGKINLDLVANLNDKDSASEDR